MFCIYCGAKIDDDSNFCNTCGRETNNEFEDLIKSDNVIAKSTQNQNVFSENTVVHNANNEKTDSIFEYVRTAIYAGVIGGIVGYITKNIILAIIAGVIFGNLISKYMRNRKEG